MPTAPFIVSVTYTQPTATVPTGTLTILADLGDSVGPLTFEIPGVTNGIVTYNAPAGYGQYAYTQSGVPPGTYDAFLYDAAPAAQRFDTLQFSVKINPAPLSVRGCTDPDADNYDPLATVDNGSCNYTVRVLAADLPELAPLGVPLRVALRSAAVVGAVAAPATALLELANLGTAIGVQVRVNGYLFSSGPVIVPGRFRDAASLVAALRAQPVLAAGYEFSQPAPTQVLVRARTPGLPGTPTVTTSDATLLSITSTPGVAGLHSERRLRWGCYVEVWAGCGNVFGGPVDKKTAVLAQRLPLDYRAGNSYEFDIASVLRQFTGHAYPLADGSCPDRLVSYFLRYGEEYADSPTDLRRPRSTYESPVAWGLEAMEVPAPVGGLRVLSARPSPWQVALGDRLPVAVLAPPASAAALVLRSRLATTRATTDAQLARPVALGVVTQGNVLAAPAGTLAGQLRLGGSVLAKLDFVAKGQLLTFVNRQGGTDSVRFSGLPDENSKRTAASYTNSAGPQNLAAEQALPTRLNSGRLDRATWDWLRRELGTSPTAWLDTPDGALAVMITDVVPDPDAKTGEYYLAVDYQPAPVRGLSN